VITHKLAAMLAMPLLLAVSAGPVAGASALAQTAGAARASSPNACNDPAYNLEGGKWTHTVGWYFQSSSSPSYLSTSNVLTVIKRSWTNMTGAYNDCGLPDSVGATSKYLGSTNAPPNISKRGFCNNGDGYNEVGFGPLPSGALAVTCVYKNTKGNIVEADIRINSNETWALTVGSCKYWQELLEPTVTHEVGHVLGLAHVGEKKHGRLTMSTTSDGPCANDETTLGWGDIRGLTALYPLTGRQP
jgi:matrixin